MHRFTTKKSLILLLLAAVGGLFGVSLLQSQGVIAAPAAIQAAVPTPPQVFFLSSDKNIKVDGLKVADEDIVRLDPGVEPGQGTFSIYFDGSDVGVANADVDAIELIDEGTYGAILMSFDKTVKMIVNGVKTEVDDSDIVKFTFAQEPGANTVGSFTSCFDGSAFDLTSGGEDIDAIAIDGTGRLIISVLGKAKVNGTALLANDEDLLALGTGAFSCNSGTGPWSVFIDGSDLALTKGSEDVGGAWIDLATPHKNLYLSVKGEFKAEDGFNAISGDGDDIFGFSPSQLGTNSEGFFFAAFDGDIEGYKKVIDAIFALPGGSALVTSANVNTVDVPVAVTQYEVVADEVDLEDSEITAEDNASDALEAEEVVTKVMLPMMFAQ